MSQRTEEFQELDNFICGVAITKAELIRFDPDDAVDITIVSLYCTILEQGRAILALIQAELGHHSQIILRSQLEALADLINLSDDQSYFDSMVYQNLAGRSDTLEAARNRNRYSQLARSAFDVAGELAKCRAQMQNALSAGVKNLQLSRKLKSANLGEIAKATIPSLNDHSHSGLAALQHRHLRKVNGAIEVHCFAEPRLGQFDGVISMSLDVVVMASIKIHERFETDQKDYFQDYWHSRTQEHQRAS